MTAEEILEETLEAFLLPAVTETTVIATKVVAVVEDTTVEVVVSKLINYSSYKAVLFTRKSLFKLYMKYFSFAVVVKLS